VLLFFDESFRKRIDNQEPFGVLCGLSIPEADFSRFQRDFFGVCKPYFGKVLNEGHEIKGKELLNNATTRTIAEKKFSYHFNLAEELLQFASQFGIRVFGIVCFKPDLQTFVCGDPKKLDTTYRTLFDSIDRYMKHEAPQKLAKIVFDSRDHQTNEKNATAITNFLVRSHQGIGYDNILKVPFFAASQANNYGLQLADLITTVVALRFQGRREFDPLWVKVQRMIYQNASIYREFSTFTVFRTPYEKAPAAFLPMAEAKPPSTGTS
jgi:Protein of unknown function (DUF3800)